MKGEDMNVDPEWAPENPEEKGEIVSLSAFFRACTARDAVKVNLTFQEMALVLSFLMGGDLSGSRDELKRIQKKIIDTCPHLSFKQGKRT